MRKPATLRDSFPACPKCTSRSVAVSLLTYYNVSIRCEDCGHCWTISKDIVAVASTDPKRVESIVG